MKIAERAASLASVLAQGQLVRRLVKKIQDGTLQNGKSTEIGDDVGNINVRVGEDNHYYEQPPLPVPVQQETLPSKKEEPSAPPKKEEPSVFKVAAITGVLVGASALAAHFFTKDKDNKPNIPPAVQPVDSDTNTIGILDTADGEILKPNQAGE